MKLLVATGIYPPESGGPATYTKLLEEQLPSRGIEVSVLPFRVVRHLPPVIRHFAYFFKCLSMARRADIVYAQDTVSVGLPAAFAALAAGKKFMVRVPGDYAWEQGRQRFGVADELDAFQNKSYGILISLLRSIQKFVVRRATKVIVPSEYMKKIVRGWLGSDKKIERIYSSINLPVPVEDLKARPEGFLVVTIARPVPWKGLDGLQRVVDREPNWKLKIVNDLPYPQAMGWVKAADAFVINSTYEGLSHALVEAMSLGTPIVATNVGGNPELIEDGVDGILISAKNDDALHAALKRIQDDQITAQARANAARAKIKMFTISETIQKLVAVLKSI